MIGVALHLMALVPAAVAARVTRAALGLLCRAPQGSEIEQLAAECDALRGERDFARAQLADAQTLAHEARLEYGAARGACEDLRGLLATARKERDEARGSVRDLLAVVERSSIKCSSCSNTAAAVDKTYAYCDEHMPPNQGQLRELSYAAALRRGRALVEVTP